MNDGHWDSVMAEHQGELLTAGGDVRLLPAVRWFAGDHSDSRLVATIAAWCTGPTVDLGCGPGRVVEVLLRRGIPALGVDDSSCAVRAARARGATAVQRDLFGPLPGEGRWSHAILLDGNIGIGGDPARLLRRAAALLEPGGSVVVEADPSATGLVREAVRVRAGGVTSMWFPWARVGIDEVGRLAAAAGFEVARTIEQCGRVCLELVR